MHLGASMQAARPIQRRAATRGTFPLTRAMVHDAAMDAAKARMRADGRAALSEDDVEVYIEAFDRLFLTIGGPDAWLDLPER